MVTIAYDRGTTRCHLTCPASDLHREVIALQSDPAVVIRSARPVA